MFKFILFFIQFLLINKLESAAIPGNTSYDQRQTGKYNIHVNIKDVSIIAVEADDLGGSIGDSGTYEDYYEYDSGDFTISPLISLLGSLANNKTTTSKPSVTSHLSTSSTTKPLGTTSKPTTSLPANSLQSSLAPNKTQNAILITEKPLAMSGSLNNTKDPIVKPEQQQVNENEIPVHIIMEPVLIPKQKTSTTNLPTSEPLRTVLLKRPSVEVLNNLSVPNGRSELRAAKKCANGQYRDKYGRCRNRRPAVFRRRLFDLLSLLKPSEV